MELTPERMEQLALAPADIRNAILAQMSPRDMLRFDAWFEAWAHEGQLPPEGNGWRTWLMMAGRGYGKTRAGAEWVHQLATPRRGTRIALVAATLHEARQIMVEGRSGLIAVADLRGTKLKWEPSSGTLRWPSGTIAQIFSGDSPEALRGPEHHYAWCDELAKWRLGDAAWDNLQMGLRAGARPRALVTTTPKPGRLLDRIRKSELTIETGGKSTDNVSLPQRFIDVMSESYGNSRLGRQELEGEYLADAEGSLFPRALLEQARCKRGAEDCERVVVAVDPPAGTTGDACGIVVAGAAAGRAYVLADRSVEGLAPEGWAAAVAAAFEEFKADRVVAEANQGGAMVEAVLRGADRLLPIQLVHATRGKAIRAEPVAARLASGSAFLAGRFDMLEDELAGLIRGGGYEGPGRSPDRADAMVWALWALTETRETSPRITRLG